MSVGSSARSNFDFCIMTEGALSREFHDFIVSVGDDYKPPKVIANDDVLLVCVLH